MRYRRAPAGGYQDCCRREGDECRDEACRRAGCRSVSHFSCRLLLAPCRIPFFLLIIPFMSFRRSACRFVISCRILLCCMALCWSGDTGCRVCHSAFVLSHLIVPSHRLITVSSHRLVLFRHIVSLSCLVSSLRLTSFRLIDSYRLDTFGDTLRSIREAGRGYHSIIHMGVGS